MGPFVAMGAIFSFFFPWEDTGPDTRKDTKEEEQCDVKKVDDGDTQDTKKKTPAEVTSETKVTVPQITEEALEEADYEVVETHNDPPSTLSASQESALSAGFPRTPQNSFATLPPGQQLDDGFEVINQRTEDDLTSLLNVYKVAIDDAVESDDIAKEEEEEEGSPIANLKSGVEALLTDLSASSGPEKEDESGSKSTTTTSAVKEETSTPTTADVQEVQTIGEVQDVGEETNTEESVDP